MSYSIIDHLETSGIIEYSLDDVLDEYVRRNPVLTAACRTRHVVDQRAYICYLYCQELQLTRQAVGNKFNLDHSTIVFYVKRHERLQRDKSYNYNIKEIKQLVKEYLK